LQKAGKLDFSLREQEWFGKGNGKHFLSLVSALPLIMSDYTFPKSMHAWLSDFPSLVVHRVGDLFYFQIQHHIISIGISGGKRCMSFSKYLFLSVCLKMDNILFCRYLCLMNRALTPSKMALSKCCNDMWFSR
jgi:hypothetical protein